MERKISETKLKVEAKAEVKSTTYHPISTLRPQNDIRMSKKKNKIYLTDDVSLLQTALKTLKNNLSKKANKE